MVGVEARKDLRDCAKVAVDKLAQTTVVVYRARARAPSNEELEVRDAERVLDVDGEEAEGERSPLALGLYRASRPTQLPHARGPRMEPAKLRQRSSARSASGAATHASRQSLPS